MLFLRLISHIILSMKNIYQKIILIIATWFGTGLIKPAPGTWGSLGGLLCFYGFVYWAQHVMPSLLELENFIFITLSATIVVFVLGVFVSSEMEKIYKKKDMSEIVIDEVAGIWIVLILAYLSPGNFWVHGLIAFALFRLFDIWKPYPIKKLEVMFNGGLKGGFGVMIDDILAAAYACIAFYLIGQVTSYFFFS